MNNDRRTKKEEQVNERKDIVFSSLYSIVSCLASLAYLIADLIFDNKISSWIAFVILVGAFFICKIGVGILRKSMEADNEKSAEICGKIAYLAQIFGYVSMVVLLLTLLCGIVL